MALNPTRVVDFFLTYDCNSACPYCFVQQNGKNLSMSDKVLKKSIDWIANTAKDEVEIVFLGGEPTLHPEKIEQAVEYARKRGEEKGIRFHFTMTTNFLNLTETLAEKLATWKVSYLMSVDGYGERHDRSRPAKDKNITSPFALLQERIGMLKKHQPKLAARITSTPFTVNWLAHDMQKLFEMGFKHFIISPATGIRWTDEKLKQFEEQLTQFSIQRGYQDGQPEPYISPVDDKEKGHQQWGCGAGRGRVSISPEGDIHACARFTGMTAKDPLTLGTITTGINPQGHILKFQDNSYQSRQKCLTCSLREECLGGCPAVNWEESNSLVTPSINECRMMKSIATVKKYVRTNKQPVKEVSHG
jgi:uncharacterized protein